MTSADDAEALVADPAGRVDVDAELDQLLDRPRGQPVAADLLARERRLLEQEHVGACLREVARRGRSARSRPDDDDVCLTLGGSRLRHARGPNGEVLGN